MLAPSEDAFSLYAGEFRPRWPAIGSTVPLLCGAGIVVQHRDEANVWRTLLLVVIAVVPLVLDDRLRARYARMRWVPEVVFSIPVFLAVFLLIWNHPVQYDISPFLLFLVTAQAAVSGERYDGIAVAVVSASIMVTADIAGHYSGSYVWLLGIALAWTGGFAFRCLLRVLTELRAAQATLAEQAAAEERGRIAREIHDVIAHSLSVASLHITGARMAVARGRADAVQALEEAEALTRESLNQVRSVVGMLEPAADGTAAALPTATDIGDLVSEFTRAGVDVDLQIDGDLAQVSPTTGLTLYRVTQESLSNVVRHAAGSPATIRICARDGTVRLSVTNPITNGTPARNGAGRGLRGMRERASTHGGLFEAGAADGYWRVELAIPE